MKAIKIAAYLNKAFWWLFGVGAVLWVVGIISAIALKALLHLAAMCLAARFIIRTFSKPDSV